jgi:Aldo/keto reductase family
MARTASISITTDPNAGSGWGTGLRRPAANARRPAASWRLLDLRRVWGGSGYSARASCLDGPPADAQVDVDVAAADFARKVRRRGRSLPSTAGGSPGVQERVMAAATVTADGRACSRTATRSPCSGWACGRCPMGASVRTRCAGRWRPATATSTRPRPTATNPASAVPARHRRAPGTHPAQVLIRWSLQRDLVVLPKSTHRERIEQNAQVFGCGLSDEDMGALDGLDRTGGTDGGLERPWW